MKKISRLTGIALAVAMIIALASISAAAFTYTPVNGTTTTFTTEITGGAVPNWTATYAVSAGEAVTSGGYETVHAGPNPESVTLTNNSTTGTGGTVTFVAGGASSFTVTVNFSAVSFSEPGVYRYVITQTPAEKLGVTPDTSATRILDVYVQDNNGALEIQSYDFLLSTAKSTGFTNTYAVQDLTVSKAVSGTQASRDKYFEFTVVVTGLTGTDEFAVDISNADATSGTTASTIAANQGKTNPTPATGAQLAAGVKFYLQHGQSITIKNLPVGAHYVVTENAENYTSNNPANSEGDIGDEDVTVAFVNTKDGQVPTGVLLTVIPGVLLLGAGIAGIVIMTKKKKSSDDDTEDED